MSPTVSVIIAKHDRLRAPGRPECGKDCTAVSVSLLLTGGCLPRHQKAERGLKVVLLEKMNFLGGASAICGGIVVIQGSKLQKELGDKGDSPSKMAYDLLDNGHQINDLNGLTFYAENVGRSIDWQVAKGIKFVDSYSYRAEHRVPRTVLLQGGCPAS